MNTKTFIPLAFTVIGFFVLISLGTWQAYRLQWKLDVIEQLESKTIMPPLTLEEALKDPEKSYYRLVRVTGRYLHEQERHLYTGPRKFKGEPGYDILTPLVTENGYSVLINRGWVEKDHKDRAQRQETVATEHQSVIAMFHKGERKRFFTPDPDRANNIWFTIEPQLMLETSRPVTQGYLRIVATEDAPTYPMPGAIKITIRNDHLHYAITWYSLAIALLVIYGLFRKKSGTS